jgi:hypothetical protein
LLPAEKYGELTVLLPAGQIQLDAALAVELLHRRLMRFDDQDYLLCIGDPVAIGLATAVAASRNYGRVKLLKWDRQEHRYYVVKANIQEN